MKKKLLSLIVLSLVTVMSVTAQTKKIKASEGTFVQGGETADETFGVSKPDVLFVLNSKTNTKWSRIGFLKFKLPEGVKSLKSVELNIKIKVFKKEEFPDSKFDLDVQAVPEGKWSSKSITFNNAPKLGTVVGSVQLDQSLDDKLKSVSIKLDAEAVNKLLEESKDGEITIALANNISAKTAAILGVKDVYLTVE